jgi:hypothetical protein
MFRAGGIILERVGEKGKIINETSNICVSRREYNLVWSLCNVICLFGSLRNKLKKVPKKKFCK